MRKFKELEFEDKLRFYDWVFQKPMFVILFSLAVYEANHAIICYLFTVTIIGDLLFFGILNNQKNYNYYNLIVDAFCLFIATFLTASFMVPYTLSLMSRFEILPTASFWMNYVTTILSVLILFLFWYIITLVQKRVHPDTGNWKWKHSGLFSSTKRLRLRWNLNKKTFKTISYQSSSRNVFYLSLKKLYRYKSWQLISK